MYIGSIIMAIGCIVYAIWNPEKKINVFIAYVGKKLSLYIYVLHISVGIFIEKVIKIVNMNEMFVYQCIKPTLVILCTIIISIVLSKVIMRKRN